MSKTMKIKNTSDDNYTEVNIIVSDYNDNGNLAVCLENAENHSPYAILTVNLKFLPFGYAAVDINNHPEAIEFIESNKIGVNTGQTVKSEFCEYPIYQFFMDKLEKIASIELPLSWKDWK